MGALLLAVSVLGLIWLVLDRWISARKIDDRESWL